MTAVTRVLVLGGNRYIGRELVFEVARRGHEVTVLNSHVSPLPEGTRRLHGDRQQPGVLYDVLAPHRDEFDIVFDNTAYDVKDLEPLVELFRDRVQQFVFTSSSAVYRRSFIQPVRETFRTHDPSDPSPLKAYGVGKVRCENYLLEEYEEHGLATTSLRVVHTIGPRSPLGSREPAFFRRLELGRPILIPAEGFPFVHLVHIRDVASLMASLIGNGAAAGQIYNVAGSEFTSVAGCMHLMARAVGVEPNIIHVPLDVARRLRAPLVHWGEATIGGTAFSIDKAVRDLDWRPQFGLEAAYRDSYEWFKGEGRHLYEFDFSADDELLAELGAATPQDG
jgi:nucleoside-diphosphate-sugar epimerase